MRRSDADAFSHHHSIIRHVLLTLFMSFSYLFTPSHVNIHVPFHAFSLVVSGRAGSGAAALLKKALSKPNSRAVSRANSPRGASFGPSCVALCRVMIGSGSRCGVDFVYLNVKKKKKSLRAFARSRFCLHCPYSSSTTWYTLKGA